MDKPRAHTGERIDSVLVVDDSAVQRQHMHDLCREIGFPAIYEARDGAEALEILNLLKFPPQLVILDLEMPGMNGVEFLDQLRARAINVPLVIASGREHALLDSVRTMAQEFGLSIRACLHKPVTREIFRAALLTGAEQQCKRAANTVQVDAAMLRAALAAGQIRVHYQPKVDIATAALRGVEALARWTHPKLGPIAPDQFIAVAERADLITLLTDTVLEQAFEQVLQWGAQGLYPSMAVNLSPRLLECHTIANRVAELASNYRVSADRIVLEITESSVLPKIGTALSVLTRLRLKGFRLSIDDYGTGYASLQQLARVPFTELKIDRSFVHLVHQRKHLEVILRTALEMTRQLGIDSVAEGVEVLEDWRLLQEFGCTLGQGWLIAPAMAGDALPGWVKKHEQRMPLLSGVKPANWARTGLELA